MSETSTETGESQSAPKKLKKESVWEVYYPSRDRGEREAVPIASFPMIIYFWPTMVTFLLCGLLQGVTRIPETALGFAAAAVWAFNLLVIVTDLDQKKFIIAVLILVLLIVLGWVAHLKHWTFFFELFAWFRGLQILSLIHI